MSNSKNSGQEPLRCSFCGRSELEVNNLIVQDNACICDNCVRACGDIIARDKVQQQVEEADERLLSRPDRGQEDPLRGRAQPLQARLLRRCPGR